LALELPDSATLARLSGDEFAFLLPGGSTDTASGFAKRILRTLEKPLQIGNVALDVGASLGIAVAPAHGMEAELLQRRADVAMHVAKSRRSGYMFYSSDQDIHSRDRLQLAADLRRSIERGELRLHYQPIISLRTGQIEEAEALVRWKHPDRGMVPPSDFIPLAEDTGMIVPIGRWVLDQACRQVVAWRSRYPSARLLRVGVNISARQFQHTDVPAEVRLVLQQTELDASSLKLEITETSAMTDPELSIASLWLLKGMGVQLAIDDFGTGYSSLSYLKRFPADTLKIDKVFVDGLGVHPEDSAIVAATIAFARAVGLTTTAEGVENADQLAELKQLGVDRVQAYYCSKPLTAAQMEALLRSSANLIEVHGMDATSVRAA